MNVAILSESSADEAAVRILTEAVLGVETTVVAPPVLRSRGWPAVRNVLPIVIKHLHYYTDAAALVIVVDSDESTVHTPRHDELPSGQPGCRLCELRGDLVRILGGLRTRPSGLELKVAIGMAVPAVEAWYAWGKIPHVNEAAWVRKLGGEKLTYDKRKLKEAVYGTIRPPITLETERATDAARRLAEDVLGLEADFPGGFGALAAALRGW